MLPYFPLKETNKYAAVIAIGICKNYGKKQQQKEVDFWRPVDVTLAVTQYLSTYTLI